MDLAPEFFEDHHQDRAPAIDLTGHAYLAFGSVYQTPTHTVQEVVQRLSTQFPGVIVAGVSMRALPRVVARPYVAQTPAMPTCNVVVCHGGRNTVLTALRHGVPVVCVPIGSDHFDIAGFVQESGAGLTAGWHEDEITAATLRVAAEPSFRASARRISFEISEMPGLDTLVRRIESLTG
ncbi:hypothetical protein J1G43_03955 [Cellulomonas sp. zg-ZUI22]|nr:hypothetical protein [Cellulomonas sp. zg-ZUI22]